MWCLTFACTHAHIRQPVLAGTVLRITPRYQESTQAKYIVARCPNHYSLADADAAPNVHLVRCDNTSVVYLTDPISASVRVRACVRVRFWCS